jgi:hypothetical protein
MMVQHESQEMTPRQRDRSTFLATLLGGAMALGFMGFFYIVAPDFFLLGTLVVFGGLHYMLWGKSMMRETEAERAALAEQARREAVQQALPNERRY